jgi:hypothetical protein
MLTHFARGRRSKIEPTATGEASTSFDQSLKAASAGNGSSGADRKCPESPPEIVHSSFVDVMKLLATESYCSDAILQELGRTQSMRARMKAVGFIPTLSEKSKALDQPRPTRSREVLARFNIVLPKPPPSPLPRWVVIGNWRRDGREIRLTRPELFERVWSEPVEKLAKEWGRRGLEICDCRED